MFVEPQLMELQLLGHEDPTTRQLLLARERLRQSGYKTLTPVLPLFLQLKGQPYSLKDHYPFEFLFHTRMPQQLVGMAGRQVAKCLPLSDEPVVWLANGRLAGTADIRAGQRVLALGADGRRRVRRVLAVHATGRKPVYRIRTRLGAEFEHTAEHRVRTFDGYTRVRELVPGSRIAAARLGGRFGSRSMRSDRVILTACLVGDGSCGCSGNLSVTSECQEVLDICQRLGQSFQYHPVRRDPGKQRTGAVHFSQSKESQLVCWLEQDGLWGRHSWEKVLPAWIFQLPRTELCLFISWLWATDGSIKPKNTITYTSTSRTLARQVRSLLAKFGIPASITGKPAYCNGKRCRDAYLVRVETRDGWSRFLQNFRVPGKPPFVVPDTEENNNRDTIPLEVQEWIDEAYAGVRCTHTGSLHGVGLRARLKYPPSRRKLAHYVKHLERRAPGPAVSRLKNLLRRDVIWDEVESIEYAGVKPTVDFEVEEDHNFVVDGVYTHNSTGISAHVVMLSACIPFFNTIMVAPRFEQIRRLSTNFVRPFIELSPIKNLLVGPSSTQSVLQKSFRNHSELLFTFAYLDAERTRGLSGSQLIIDEVQDMDPSHLPILGECLSASRWKLKKFMGTPRGKGNTLSKLYDDSSQAEWLIKCHHGGCGHWNIPALEFDLLKMIGSYRSDISEDAPGLVCAKCQNPLRPRTGRWIHGYPERRWTFAGYHLPQVIFPMHYADKEAWKLLLAKQRGAGNTPMNVFLNECLGVPFDLGSQIVTVTDLKRACVLEHHNKIEEASAPEVLHRYLYRMLACDWGGGGGSGPKDRPVSFTSIAVLGVTGDGKIDVIYGHRSLRMHEHEYEAKLCLHLMHRFKCSHIAHDFNGAGALRETFLIQAGLPPERIVPIAYHGNVGAPIMAFRGMTGVSARSYYAVHKSQSLALTCQQIKHGRLRFFQDDYLNADEPGLVRDFLALKEEQKDSRLGGDTYTIVRDPVASDDFAQAVNMGACALWFMTDKWPDVAETAKMKVTSEMSMAMMPNYRAHLDQSFYGY